jgi:hypothetical protein
VQASALLFQGQPSPQSPGGSPLELLHSETKRCSQPVWVQRLAARGLFLGLHKYFLRSCRFLSPPWEIGVVVVLNIHV